MLPIVAVPVLVGLRPHGHTAMGAMDQTFEQVLAFRVAVEGPAPSGVAPHGARNALEDTV